MLNHPILAIYDGEGSYTAALAGKLAQEAYMPYEICAFTKEEALLEYQKEHPIQVLLVSEEAYRKGLLLGEGGMILLLRESSKELTYEEEVHEIPRFQSVQGIYRSILRYCEEAILPREGNEHPAKLIGFFSPIKRCLQSTMAMELGKYYGEKGKTLYLDFECFSAWESPFESESGDLTDLVYYMDCAKAQFPSRFESLIHSNGNLDWVQGPRSFLDLDLVEKEKWLQLLRVIRGLGKYDTIILDLCEQVQGIFQILEECESIITIERTDPASRTKLERYENLLRVTGHGNLLEKTSRWLLPTFSSLVRPEEDIPSEVRNYLVQKEQ